MERKIGLVWQKSLRKYAEQTRLDKHEKKISVDVNRDRQQGDPNFKKLNKKKQYIQKKVSR